ncbi:MAG: hypothetical protein KatS3mg104_3059 [Phycisphaerae bacterium]|nr:MAG: hypothetical protein KatS3mg104_3059 [Phycisphaerae bacterium]
MIKKFFDSIFGSRKSVKQKSVTDGLWGDSGFSESEPVSPMTFRAFQNTFKDLTPKQMYELSVCVNACNNAIARNVSLCKIRIYNTDGMEVVGGRLYNLLRRPSPRMTMRTLLNSLVTWWNVLGEMAVYVGVGEDGYPDRLIDLDPSRLSVYRPAIPNNINDVIQWQYMWHDGKTEYIRRDWILFERMWNPIDPVRGLSPLVTGSTAVNTGHGAWKYNKDHFANGGIPSHIVNLGAGVSRRQREEFESRYKSEFSNASGNSHKVMVVSGKEISIEKLSSNHETGWFVDLFDKTDEAIARLYRVPAIEAFFLSKTRFDTATEERKMFMQSTIQPIADLISDMIQTQLIDVHFSDYSDDEIVLNDSGKTKYIDSKLEQYFYERQGSRYFVVLDTDTLPIMAEIKTGMLASAKAFRETADASANEALNYFGIELPYRKERDEIWVDRNKICISNPQFNAELFSAEMQAKQELNSVKPDGSAASETEESDSEDKTKSVVAEADLSNRKKKRLKRALVILAKKCHETGDPLDLKKADKLVNEILGDSVGGRVLARHIRNEYRKSNNKEDFVQSLSSYLRRVDIKNDGIVENT